MFRKASLLTRAHRLQRRYKAQRTQDEQGRPGPRGPRGAGEPNHACGTPQAGPRSASLSGRPSQSSQPLCTPEWAQGFSQRRAPSRQSGFGLMYTPDSSSLLLSCRTRHLSGGGDGKNSCWGIHFQAMTPGSRETTMTIVPDTDLTVGRVICDQRGCHGQHVCGGTEYLWGTPAGNGWSQEVHGVRGT